MVLGNNYDFQTLFGLALITAIMILIGIYVYWAICWMTIAKKLGYKKPWIMFIPFANIAVILQLGGFHWAFVFLALIPILGWIALGVLIIIASWKIFLELNYPGWLSLAPLLTVFGGIMGFMGVFFYSIALGFVAWKER